MQSAEFSKLTGLNFRQLDYLVKLGVISKPEYRGKRRTYDEYDLWIADLVGHFKKNNLAVERIKPLSERIRTLDRTRPFIFFDKGSFGESIQALAIVWFYDHWGTIGNPNVLLEYALVEDIKNERYQIIYPKLTGKPVVPAEVTDERPHH